MKYNVYSHPEEGLVIEDEDGQFYVLATIDKDEEHVDEERLEWHDQFVAELGGHNVP